MRPQSADANPMALPYNCTAFGERATAYLVKDWIV